METKRCSHCCNTKPVTEFFKNKRWKSGLSYLCKSCATEATMRWRSENYETVRATSKQWVASNRGRRRQYQKEYDRFRQASINKKERREYQRKWYAENIEAERARGRKYSSEKKNVEAQHIRARKWRKAHPEAECARSAKKRTCQRLATPTWANSFFILEAYRLAILREKYTGIKWHVDHMVPLQSKLVCGLHVENNLQVIPATENVRKYNKSWPDMW